MKMEVTSQHAAKPIIHIEGLSVSYGIRRVLTNVYLSIFSGHIYGIIGPNGAGKSTLFKSMLELIPQSTGRISIFGEKVDEVRKRIAYVPQRDEIDWSFPANVMDVVLMGRYPHITLLSRISSMDRRRALKALELVDMADFKHRQIGQLSGGQQQRVFLARALCQEADIILLDEPFVGVDLTTEQKIVSILKDQASQGRTLLVVHHDLSTVMNYFSHVVLLNQRLIAAGPVETTFTDELVSKAYGAQLDILHKSGLDNKK